MLSYAMDSIMEKRLLDANDLREAEKYGDSAKAYTECLIDLVDTNDYQGLIHCLGGQSLIYKNLLSTNDSPIYHYLTVSYAKEALQVGESHKETLDGRTLAIAYSSYGNALIVNGEYSEALSYFEKSLAVTTADVPEKGRLKAHIGGLLYKLGEKDKGKALIEQALAEIRSGDLNAYAIRVWETGALNCLAKIYLQEENKEKALSIAKESFAIAESHNLSIRKREVENIISQISSDKKNLSL